MDKVERKVFDQGDKPAPEMTWQELRDWIRERFDYGQCDYVEVWAPKLGDEDRIGALNIWEIDEGHAGNHWIGAYWVEGGSEGYYVHVHAVRDCTDAPTRLLAKFWNLDDAEYATRQIQRFVNGFPPKGRK